VPGLAALVRERPAVRQVRLVTVDGFSGAGKSRLAARLAGELGGVPTVHLDFFYPGWDGLAAAVDLAVEWVAVPLVAGRAARWRRFDWDAGRFAEWRETPWAPVVVLEGCGAGSAALRPYTSTALWVETPAELRERRLRARVDWPLYAPHRARWAAQESAHFAAERPWEHADAVIDGAREIDGSGNRRCGGAD
jgi:cytidylate kinase